MQRLKDDTRARILAAGRAAFAERGFAGASMRDIAARAGVTAGNVYRYFRGKDGLFDAVVGPAHRALLSVVRADRGVDRRAVADFRAIEPVIERVLDACRTTRTEILILADHGAGTRYADLKGALARAIEKRLRAGLRVRGTAAGDRDDGFVLHVMASTFVEGFLMIIRRGGGEARMTAALRRLLALFFEDIAGRMAHGGGQ
jgi:AcrR family transcriptional regulator